MKITVRGWSREAVTRVRKVTPVEHSQGRFRPETLSCASDLEAYGEIDELGLSGNFLVKFDFEELRKWLLTYA